MRAIRNGSGGLGYIAYDPQEDTETCTLDHGSLALDCYIAYDPQEDTETPSGTG